jgi:hypothetical protein
MRRILITSFAAALFAAALPASAETIAAGSGARGEADTQQPRARTGEAVERRICVREQLSDSRMRRQVCHTAREWRQLHGSETDAR